jgi:6-pyruvoyl-tetrahydropterin synthase
MYTVGMRDHIEVVGGASPTPSFGVMWAVCVEVAREELTPGDVVVEPALLRRTLRGVLEEIEPMDLDDHPAFEGRRATPEILARHVHHEVGRRLPVTRGVMLTVTLEESPAAWVRYAAPLRPTPAREPL